MLEKLKIKITLLASLIVTAYALFNNEEFIKTCYTIVFTIVIFYIIGGFIEIWIKRDIERLEELEQLEQEQLENMELNENIELDENMEDMDLEEANNIS